MQRRNERGKRCFIGEFEDFDGDDWERGSRAQSSIFGLIRISVPDQPFSTPFFFMLIENYAHYSIS
jgi:hypothetical protein